MPFIKNNIKKNLLFFLIIIQSITTLDIFADVNPDGSFGTQIPIKIPPGTKNISPKLSLVYNSNSGNGMVGVGWSLNGLAYITRINYGKGINYDGSDTYMSSNHGVLVNIGGGVYHSKVESFTKFNKSGACGDGPCYWIATDKSGIKYYYGDTNDSRIEKVGSSSVRVWALSKVEDLFGNYYEINYLEDIGNGSYYPSLITYTKNNGISKYRTIEFQYESRTDQYPGYDQSAFINVDKRLKWLIIRSDGQLVHKYSLNYEYSVYTKKSRLISLQDYGNDGTSVLLPQTFSYQNGENGFITGGYNIPSQMYYHYSDGRVKSEGILQDINGDGLADFTKATCWEGGACDLAVYHGTGNGFVNAGYNLPGAVYYHYADGRVKTEGVLQDINGDGKADFCKATAWEGGAVDTVVHHGTGNGFVNSGYSLPGYIFYHYSNGHVKTEGILQDINGDGLADFSKATAWEGGSTDTTVHHGTGNGFVNAGYSLPSAIYYHYADGRVKTEGILQDINGDGLTDFSKATAWEGGGFDTVVHHGTGSGFVNAGYSLPGYIFFHYSDGRVKTEGILQDINGDGKADFTKATAWEGGAVDTVVHHGTGNSFVNAGYSLPGYIFYHYSDGRVKVEGILQNINGDGIADFSKATAWEGGAVDTVVHHGTGNGFVNAGYSLPNNIFYHYADGRMKMEGILQDINGDGKADFCKATAWEGGSPAPDLLVFHGKTPQADFLISLTNSYGATTTVSYALSTYLSGVNNPSQSSYPIISNPSSRYLVTQTTIHDGRGANYSTGYEYYNGKYYIGQVSEVADLGFEWVKKIINQTGSYELTYYRQDKPLHGAVKEKRTYAAGGLLMQKDSFNYEVVHPYSQTQFIRLVSLIKSTYEMGNFVFNKSREFVNYDQYGNVTKMVDKADATDTIEIITAYNYDVSNWILNRPVEAKKISNGQTLQWQRFIYSGNYLIEKKDYLDTNNSWISTKYSYDNFGNISVITDALGSETKLFYDSLFRTFIIKAINPLNHIIEKSYNVNGNVTSMTDPNGNVRTRVYDVFGRITRVIEPGDDWTKEYLYANIGNPNNQYTEIRLRDNSQDGYQWSRTYMDGLGRKYKTVSEWDKKTGNSLLLIKEYEYDNAGRLYRESNDYVSNYDEKYFTTYLYDSVGRLVKKIYRDETASTMNYNGASAIKTDRNGNSQTDIPDARGRIVKKIDAGGGSISYSYNPLGKLSKVIDAGGEVTTITYDSLGRKIFLSDPNSGNRTYTYNALAQLIEQVDAKNQKINYQYDKIGRRVLEDFPDDETDVRYIYDDPAITNAIGRLTKIVDSSGESFFSYDVKGNISNWMKSIDGYNFTFNMTYDQQRRLVSTEYPDGTKSRNLYSDGGYLKQVEMAKKGNESYPVVKYKRPSGNSEIVRSTGNGIDTTIKFDPKTNRPMSRVTVFQGETLQDLSYTFDNVGNVMEINDNFNPDATQNFNYDILYRLTTATGIYGDKTYSYNNSGNLLYKDNKNLYYNDSLHPSAVTSDSLGNSYQYDANGNMIKRNNQTLDYDAKNRLISLIKNSKSKEHHHKLKEGLKMQYAYTYNYKGMRVKKVTKKIDDHHDKNENKKEKSKGKHKGKDDNDNDEEEERDHGHERNIVYNIGGIYEMAIAPNQHNRHTRLTSYIYGLKGDLVAQSTITVDNSLAINFLNPSVKKTLAAMYSVKNPKGIFYKAYFTLNATTISTKTYWVILKTLFIIFSISMFMVYILNKWRPVFWSGKSHVKRSRHSFLELNHLILVIFFGTFIIFGSACGRPDDKEAPNGNPPWSGLNENPFDKDTPDISDQTENNDGGDHNDKNNCGAKKYSGFPIPGVYFFHPNHQRSISFVTDTGGNVISRVYYNPYGEIDRTNSNGPDIFRYKYTGQEEDRDTGLYYYKARFYDPAVGRFITPDSIIPDYMNTQAYNRYTYAYGNPVNYSDPTGFYSWGDFWDDAGGVVDDIGDGINDAIDWVGDTWTGIVTKTKEGIKSLVGEKAYNKIVNPTLSIISRVIRGSVYGVMAAVLGGITGAIVGGSIGGPVGAIIGAVIGIGIGFIGGFLAGYNDIYSYDWRGLTAFVSDYTWSLPNTFLGLGYMAYAYSRGGRLSGLSRQSNAFVIMGNANIVPSGQAGFTIGNVIGINTAAVVNPAFEKENFLHEQIHVWQYRGFGPTFLPLYGLDAAVHKGNSEDMWFEKPAEDYQNDSHNVLTAGTY